MLTFFNRTTRFRRGFTMIEIIIVVVMLGILASIAIPQVLGPNERIRASEGTQVLSVLLGAQKRYALENSDNYATDIGTLDVTIPHPNNFNDPGVANNAAALASIQRNDGTYTLSIDQNGFITCAPAGAACTAACKGGTACN